MNFLGHTSTNSFVAGASAVFLHQTNLLTGVESLLYCASFIFATLMLGPDLDLYHSKVNKNWGVFRWIWWPYAKLSKHRGLSHTPVVSTGIRLLYLFLVVAVVLMVARAFYFEHSFFYELKESFVEQNHSHISSYLFLYKYEITAVVIGIMASDLFHLASDYFSTYKKKLVG